MSSPHILWESPLQSTVAKDTVLFNEINGIYYLCGEKLAWMLRFVCEPVYCDVLGADYTLLMRYVPRLLDKGIKVGVIKGNTVRMLDKSNPSPRPKVESTTIGLPPELLEGRKELERLARSREMKRYSTQELINTIKQHLATSNTKEIAEYGTLYVYRIHDSFEIDYELTTIPRSLIDALLVAAYQSGKMLKAELVEPKGRRKRGRKLQREITVSEPVTYGQMKFEL